MGIMKRSKGQVERGLGIEETSDFNLVNVSKLLVFGACAKCFIVSKQYRYLQDLRYRK